jgi:N-acetylneuraminate synthase/N,N'-diacetyllegionaminate synthase
MAAVISAELGINHNGNPEIAEDMIVAARKSGAGAVKVQSYREEDIPADNPEPQALIACQIWPYLERLSNCAHENNLLFGVTASSIAGVYEAVSVGADFLKNASEAILRLDLIEAMLETGLPTWVSTGMASVAEIDAVLSLPGDNLKLMVCTSMYPCPDGQVNLDRLGWGFKGFSDHTQGHMAACLAASYRVEMIEKHFTLSHLMDGPDHWFSADPAGLRYLIQSVCRAEVLLGSGDMGFMPGEAEAREKWRMAPA